MAQVITDFKLNECDQHHKNQESYCLSLNYKYPDPHETMIPKGRLLIIRGADTDIQSIKE